MLARYREPAYGGGAALTRRAVGTGACLTLGAWGDAGLLSAVLEPLLADAGVATTRLPEAVRRSRVGRGALLNFGADDATVDGIRVPGHGVAFLHPA